MGIELSDLDGEDDLPPKSLREPTGAVLLLDEGGWVAASREAGEARADSGSPTDLPPGICWIVNCGYNDMRTLEGTQSRKDIRLRANDWLRSDIETIFREWGFATLAPGERAELLSRLFGRTLDITFEAVRSFNRKDTRTDGAIFSSLTRSPSLATGLRSTLGSRIDETAPTEAGIIRRLADAVKYGGFIVREKEIGPGEREISMRRPRLAHALEVTAKRVPRKGKWQKAGVPDEPLSDKTLQELEVLDRPVLVTANLVQRDVIPDPYMASWMRKPDAEMSRMSYTLEEVRAMQGHWSFQQPRVVVGPGWQDSACGELLAALVEACGGPDVAHASWTANLIAENMLCGSFRPGRARGKRGGEKILAPESVWLSARDRILLHPFASAMNDLGATVFSGYAGELRVKASDDPEILAMVVNAAWEAGMSMPIATVKALHEAGVEVPTEREFYGGAPETLLLSWVAQRGQRNVMWKLDAILDERPGQRADALKTLLS